MCYLCQIYDDPAMHIDREPDPEPDYCLYPEKCCALQPHPASECFTAEEMAEMNEWYDRQQ